LARTARRARLRAEELEVAHMRRRLPVRLAAIMAGLSIAAGATGIAGASVPGSDVRLTNDAPTTDGYTSNYTMVTGQAYTDATLDECSRSRGRENEPAVAVDPRDTNVIVGSANDYCAVYNDGEDENGAPIPSGPIWLGYYRSTDAGASFSSSLVPGYPGDTSPYAGRAQIRTASSGDPVLAWDNEGRLFAGSESSDDPAGTLKTFGDVWVATYENPQGVNGPTSKDGLEFKRSVIVARGSSAPNLLGKFNDKTTIEADRTSSDCAGNVYFSWTRFTGNGGVGVYLVRSTDHGRTWSSPMKVSASIHDVQFPDIAITGNGDVFVVWREFSGKGQASDAVDIVKSTDCGATFGKPRQLAQFIPYDAQDVAEPEPTPTTIGIDDPGFEEDAEQGTARDCGDFAAHCQSGYTFFRRDSQVRATADQLDPTSHEVYLVADVSKPGSLVDTGTTYGSVEPGIGSQSAIFFARMNGATGQLSSPIMIDDQPTGHQLFPDISADGGVLHAIWWDSRNDPCYSAARPIGNCADRTTVSSLDAYGASSTDRGNSWSVARLSDTTSNPNYEQFGGRTVPFAGDYLYVSSVGDFAYGVWTDWRNTVAGTDQRESSEEDNDAADVLQCRTLTDAGWTEDTCPRNGGLDQDIYGDYVP
jgi:hypothetical protein